MGQQSWCVKFEGLTADELIEIAQAGDPSSALRTRREAATIRLKLRRIDHGR